MDMIALAALAKANEAATAAGIFYPVYLKYCIAGSPNGEIEGYVCNHHSSDIISAAESGKIVIGIINNQKDIALGIDNYTGVLFLSNDPEGDGWGFGGYFLREGFQTEFADMEKPAGTPPGTTFDHGELWIEV